MMRLIIIILFFSLTLVGCVHLDNVFRDVNIITNDHDKLLKESIFASCDKVNATVVKIENRGFKSHKFPEWSEGIIVKLNHNIENEYIKLVFYRHDIPDTLKEGDVISLFYDPSGELLFLRLYQ